VLDEELTGRDELRSVTDVEQDFVTVDLDDGPLDDVAIVEVFDVLSTPMRSFPSAMRLKPWVLTKEEQGRPPDPVQEAGSVRARLGTIEELKEKDEAVKGTVIEVVKGGLILDIGLRGFLPASLVEMRRVRDLQPYIGRRSRPRSSSSTRTATTWC